jgi:phage baseplate assembly protein W
MVKTVNGYRAVDTNYGSYLMTYLSAPITSEFLSAVVEEAEKTALQDPRIATTQGNITGVEMSEVKLQLYSSVEPEPSQTVTVGEFDLNGLPVGTVNTNYQFVLPLGGLN